MPKSQIIKDIVEDNVSLEKSLTRLLVLAKDVKNKQLAQWAENELNGYKKTDEVPDYRHVKSSVIQYNGFNGNFQVQNISLPTGWIRPEIMKSISAVTIYDGIRNIEDIASSQNGAYRDYTELAGEIGAATNNEVICTSIRQMLVPSIYQRICAEVKNKMIHILMELEKAFGSLDTLGVNISDKRPVQVEAINDKLNRTILNINVASTETKNDPWYSKIAWRILIPIFTTIVGAVIAAIAIKYYGF